MICHAVLTILFGINLRHVEDADTAILLSCMCAACFHRSYVLFEVINFLYESLSVSATEIDAEYNINRPLEETLKLGLVHFGK